MKEFKYKAIISSTITGYIYADDEDDAYNKIKHLTYKDDDVELDDEFSVEDIEYLVQCEHSYPKDSLGTLGLSDKDFM